MISASMLTPVRRRLARLLVIATLVIAPAAVLAGCGAGTHYVENVVAHHVANHLIGKKRANKVFCVVSVYQTVHDFHGHHYLFGALTLRQAFKNCEAGFSKNAK
jgi:hypothetical protein